MAIANYSTCGRGKLLRPVERDAQGNLVGMRAFGNAGGSLLQSPALALEFQPVSVVQEPVEQRCYQHHIAGQPGPVLDGPVLGD